MGETTPKDLLDCGGTFPLSQYLTTLSVPTAMTKHHKQLCVVSVWSICQACCFPTQDTWLNMASNLPCHFSITHIVLQISLKCFHLCRLRWNIFLRTQLQVLQHGLRWQCLILWHYLHPRICAIRKLRVLHGSPLWSSNWNYVNISALRPQ